MAPLAVADKDCFSRREGLRSGDACLSQREKQVVMAVAQAKTNREIAEELGLTPSSVKEYLYRIFPKLGVRSRVELALWFWGIRRKAA